MSGTRRRRLGRSSGFGRNGPTKRRLIPDAASRLKMRPGRGARLGLRLLPLEAVEQALDGRLVPAVEAGREPVGRPRLVDAAVIRPGRVGADGRGIDERGHARLGRCPEDPLRAVDVHAPERLQVARGLDQPCEVDDGVGPAKERREVRRRDIRLRPLDLVHLKLRTPARDTEHRFDLVLLGQRSQDARPNVPGGSDDDDAHVPPLPVGHATEPGSLRASRSSG